MTTRLDRPATVDGLFLWAMHRFSEVFEDHAVLKGGVAFRLLDSPRYTTDIDFVFVPFTSKNEIRSEIEEVLSGLPDAEVRIDIHSRMIRAMVRVDEAQIQIEVNVAPECGTVPMATGGFARSLGHPSQVIRMMSPAHALADKIAAWNERRLARDLYDSYFLFARLETQPEIGVLDARLAHVDSRIPRLRRKRSMSRKELADELRAAAREVTAERLRQEIEALLPPEEMAGLDLRLKAALHRLADVIDMPEDSSSETSR